MEEIEYPKEGDSLKASSNDWKLNAAVVMCRFSESMSWHAYVQGYREAAETVFTHVDKTRMSQDFLVYPMLFLWHHHIELRLKELICRCQDLEDRPKNYDFSHKLSELWRIVKEHVTEIYPGYADDPETSRVEVVIEQLSEINSRSHALRYPEDRKYEFGMPESIERINLGVVDEVMCRCANHLGTISDGLSALQESRDNARRDSLG